MKEIIEKVTNFINENTMLLIGICAFLIIVLIIYLIDNSIKTKKMQKAIKEMDEVEDKVIDSNLNEDVPEDDTPVDIHIKDEEVTESEPEFDSISLVDEDKEYEEETEVDEPVTPTNIDVEINPKDIPSKEITKEEKPEETKFTNKKSLSEILAKKKETINNNDADKTLEETTDFSNTF